MNRVIRASGHVWFLMCIYPACYAKSWFHILPCFNSFGSRVSTCCVFKAQPPVITLHAFPVKWKENYLIIVLVRLVQNIAQTHISCFFEIRLLMSTPSVPLFKDAHIYPDSNYSFLKGKIQTLNPLTNKLTNNFLIQIRCGRFIIKYTTIQLS